MHMSNIIHILIWAVNFIIKSITRSFIMLNAMMKNENTSFANISIPFLRSCSQHDLREGSNNVFIFHQVIQHDEASGFTFL